MLYLHPTIEEIHRRYEWKENFEVGANNEVVVYEGLKYSPWMVFETTFT